MKKKQTFVGMHLSLDGIRELDQFLIGPDGVFNQPHSSVLALLEPNRAEWIFDNSETFLADYHPSLGSCYERVWGDIRVTVVNYLDLHDCKVEVKAPNKKTIEDVFAIIEKHAELAAVAASTPQGWQVSVANA